MKKEARSSHRMARESVGTERKEAEPTARRAASEEGRRHSAADRAGNIGGGAGKVRRQAGKLSKVQEMAHGVRGGGQASAQGRERKARNGGGTTQGAVEASSPSIEHQGGRGRWEGWYGRTKARASEMTMWSTRERGGRVNLEDTKRNRGGHNRNASKGGGGWVGVGQANEEGRGFGWVDALAGGRAKGSQGRSERSQGSRGEVTQVDRGVVSKVG